MKRVFQSINKIKNKARQFRRLFVAEKVIYITENDNCFRIVNDIYNQDPSNIDVKGFDHQRFSMFAHIQNEWTTLGNSEPYFSVITDQKFKS